MKTNRLIGAYQLRKGTPENQSNSQTIPQNGWIYIIACIFISSNKLSNLMTI